jgi:ATP-dependent DNA helicase RecQ
MPPKPLKKLMEVDVAAAAKRLLNFPSLRAGQEEAIRSLLAERDTVLIAPTGSGKSAVYQIAGSLMEGATVIVSPLIALQKDQVESIEQSKLAEPVVVNSTQAAGERREQLDRIEGGKADFIFLAPEQLHKQETIERLQAAGVALFAVDEAHCISQWGHDFRPDYLELAHVIETLGHPTTLAMTATASTEVRADIVERLGLNDPLIIVRGFDRPNISLRVDSFATENEKLEAVLRRVEFADKPGIIYVATHHHAESIADDLRGRRVEALAYHGGMKTKERDSIQNRFMSGEVSVIVATNAFGMGVDKPDIRFVYHADASESLDAYHQEIGRAGRDGKPAEAVLFYRSRDISAQRYKTGAGKVDARQLESVANVLVSHDAPKTSEHLSRETGIPPRKLTNIIHKFEETGAARKLASGQIRLEGEQSAAAIAEAAFRQQEFLKELRGRRLEQMREYAETRGCRREYLLRYFGDDFAGPCGNCDRCEAAGALRRSA